MSGSREEGTYPNDPILSVRPPVLLTYEPRIDSSVAKDIHFLDTLCTNTVGGGWGVLLLRPQHIASLLSGGCLLMSVIHFPGCPLANLGHMGLTNQSLQSGGGVTLGQPCDRKRRIYRYLHGDALFSLPLLPPLPQRLGVCLTPGPEQKRPPPRVAPRHSHP